MPKSKSRKAPNQKVEISPELFAELTRLAMRPPTVVKAVRAKRQPSKYNIFMQTEMRRLKEQNPSQPISQRFKQSVENWKNCRNSPDCVGRLPRKLTPRNRRN
jgi:hypothetical protein